MKGLIVIKLYVQHESEKRRTQRCRTYSLLFLALCTALLLALSGCSSASAASAASSPDTASKSSGGIIGWLADSAAAVTGSSRTAKVSQPIPSAPPVSPEAATPPAAGWSSLPEKPKYRLAAIQQEDGTAGKGGSGSQDENEKLLCTYLVLQLPQYCELEVPESGPGESMDILLGTGGSRISSMKPASDGGAELKQLWIEEICPDETGNGTRSPYTAGHCSKGHDLKTYTFQIFSSKPVDTKSIVLTGSLVYSAVDGTDYTTQETGCLENQKLKVNASVDEIVKPHVWLQPGELVKFKPKPVESNESKPETSGTSETPAGKTDSTGADAKPADGTDSGKDRTAGSKTETGTGTGSGAGTASSEQTGKEATAAISTQEKVEKPADKDSSTAGGSSDTQTGAENSSQSAPSASGGSYAPKPSGFDRQALDDYLSKVTVGSDGLISNQVFNASVGSIHYSCKLPANFNADTSYPLIIAVPGSGEYYSKGAGRNLNWQGFKCWDLVEEPHILVSPQENGISKKDAQMVIELTEFFMKTFPVDLNRVYGTGFSAGGHVMSQVVSMRPDIFAAYIHGSSHWDGTFPEELAKERVGVYIFIGTSDVSSYRVNSPVARDTLLSLYRSAGLSEEEISELLVYNEIPGANHVGANNSYLSNAAMREWLFAQHKGG